MSSESTAPRPASPSEGVRPGLIWVTVAVAALIIVLDQITKALAIQYLAPRDLPGGGGSVKLIGSFLQLTYTENRGAAFGMGTGFTWIFAAIALIVAIIILRTARRIGSVWWAVALGGLLGGALGNLVDRLVREPGIGQGYVVDFIELPYWPIFNVADMSIVCSAVLMVILTLRGIPMTQDSQESAPESTAGTDG